MHRTPQPYTIQVGLIMQMALHVRLHAAAAHNLPVVSVIWQTLADELRIRTVVVEIVNVCRKS